MFSFSPPTTQHPQVIHVYAIEIFAGLNGLQVDYRPYKLIKKTINELLFTLLLAGNTRAQKSTCGLT